jgi:peptide/nickel transport system permease protein
MKRFWARQVARLILGLGGAAIVAVALSAISEPHANNLPGYLMALAARLTQLSKGDFGHSLISGLPVLAELRQQLPPTFVLIGSGAVLALLIGLPLGLLFAIGAIRRLASPLLQIVTATPLFCVGLALAYFTVRVLHWPVSINMRIGQSIPAEEALRLMAPAVATVGLAGAAAVQLALRRAAAHSSDGAFRTGMKRMGLSATEIELRYVLPQILAGLMVRAGDIALALVSAAVVAEWVFHRGGAADLFVKSVALTDWNMTAVILFSFAALTITTNFLGQIFGYLLARQEEG